MYTGINPENFMGLFYFPVWILRFFLLIMIGAIFCEHPVFEIQGLMLLNITITIWYFQYMPHFNLQRTIHEGVHECFSMLGAYHLIVYTKAYSFKANFYSGYSFYILLAILCMSNFIYIGVVFGLHLKKQRELNQKKKNNQKWYDEKIMIRDKMLLDPNTEIGAAF